MNNNSSMSNLKKLSDAATAGPWKYRPDRHDDWGVIRGGEIQDGKFGPLKPPVARAAPLWHDPKDFDEHRSAGTDPMKDNGIFITELVNAYREGRLIEIDPEERPEDAGVC